MAAELELVSTKRLEGRLEAAASRKPVPNRLSDTRIFVKVKNNEAVQIHPTVIHFDGYKVGETHKQTLKIINASRHNQQMHIVPPTTPFFHIQYSKQRSSLVPGLSLEVVVQFTPTKWKYYYDCIRIHCKGEQNLLVPIHAYPVMSTVAFPTTVNFPPTPIGQSHTKTVSLSCDVPIDFEFHLSYLQAHHDFSVTPKSGIVPAESKVDISVTFTPTEFSTAIMKMQVELSQFNSRPLICTLIGSSSPGLAVEQLRRRSSDPKLGCYPSKSHSIPPAEKRKLRVASRQHVSSTGTLPNRVEEETVYEGFLFPGNLETPSAVAKVLAQQPGKLKAKELRQASSHVHVGGRDLGSRQQKEALFLQQVRQATEKERANQLRWVTNLGSVALTVEEKEDIIQARAAAREAYQHRCHIAGHEEELSTKCTHKRTRRRVGEQYPDHTPKFDVYVNNDWQRRHTSLQRFVQAGRQAIIRQRCQKRLKRLKSGVNGKEHGQPVAEMSGRQKEPSVTAALPVAAEHILPCSLPKYIEHKKTDASDCPLEVKPIAVVIMNDAPYLDLKVPQHYKLLGYSQPPISMEWSYIAPGLSRQLRTGAEHELQSLGCVPGVDSTFLTPPAVLTTSSPAATTTKEHTGVTEVLTHEANATLQDADEEVGEEESLPLILPPALLNPLQRQALEIFRPVLGVNQHVQMLPNSEISLNHGLQLFQSYSSAKHHQVKLEAQDVALGVMRWKHFSCQSLMSLAESNQLSVEWRPMWSDVFSEDLLPCTEPCLVSGLEPDDHVDESSTEVVPVTDLDMVQAQFYIPIPTTKQDARAQAMKKLQEEQSQNFNQLGQMIGLRLQSMLSHLKDSELKLIEEEGGD